MHNLTKDKRTFGPLTLSKPDYKAYCLVYGSYYKCYPSRGGYPVERVHNALTLHVSNWFRAELKLPGLLQPQMKEALASKEYRCNELINKQYGFSLSYGNFLEFFYGIQPENTQGAQHHTVFLPWMEKRLSTYEYYGADGTRYWADQHTHVNPVKREALFEERRVAREKCTTVDFILKDCDDTLVIAKTKVIRYGWKQGTGWFRWLSWFKPEEFRVNLDITFSHPVGHDKNEQQGGRITHTIIMYEGERRESALKRFCATPQYAYNGEYHLTFVKAI